MPLQIRNHHLFLNPKNMDPHIQEDTIACWLTDAEGHREVEQLLTGQENEARQLRARVAELEAHYFQLQAQLADWDRQQLVTFLDHLMLVQQERLH